MYILSKLKCIIYINPSSTDVFQQGQGEDAKTEEKLSKKLPLSRPVVENTTDLSLADGGPTQACHNYQVYIRAIYCTHYIYSAD